MKKSFSSYFDPFFLKTCPKIFNSTGSFSQQGQTSWFFGNLLATKTHHRTSMQFLLGTQDGVYQIIRLQIYQNAC